MALKTDKSYVSCQIIDTGPKYMPVQYAFGIAKGSPFFQLFYYRIQKLKETGVYHRYAQSYGGQFQICPDSSGMPISPNQSFTAFMVIILGMGICMVCFV